MKAKRTTALLGTALLAAALLLAPAPAGASVVQKQGVRVTVKGKLAPHRLPRHGTAPVAVAIAGHIAATAAGSPPQLRTLRIAINRQGRLSARGIPLCRLGHISPSTTREALAACGPSLVGEGHFSANVKLPEQSPFPSEGKVLAFNGRLRGKPAVFAHIYGTEPVPTSYVLPFLIESSGGTFGTVLETSLPQVTGEWGFVTGISIRLDRRFTARGKTRSFLVAGCPAPAGFGSAVFPLMRTTFAFAGGLSLTDTLSETCNPSG
jgi:hypothetical protein